MSSHSGTLVFKRLENVVFWTRTINVFYVYNNLCTHMGTHTGDTIYETKVILTRDNVPKGFLPCCILLGLLKMLAVYQ